MGRAASGLSVAPPRLCRVSRRRALRLSAVGAAAVLAAVMIVVVVLVVSFVRRPLPDRGEDVSLSGLAGDVTVVRDERAVPQIYADDARDLFRAQGYVQAQDRFFEMDVRRHITEGRLSELVGANDDALRADAVVRTLGWRRVAQEELGLLSPATRGTWTPTRTASTTTCAGARRASCP